MKLEEFTKQFTSQMTESQSQQFDNPASIGPHYEVPNLTSMLYEYTNREQERIS